MSTTAPAAQTALGKFYLHVWDHQVLVDWANSVVETELASAELTALAGMGGASREEILDQFETVVILNDLDVDFDERTAVTAYLHDLRRRVLADEIDTDAAFAQVRPLAYDLLGPQLAGLTELDEDLNLLDSGEVAYHHPNLTPANRRVYLRKFFRDLRILDPLPRPGEGARRPAREPREPSAPSEARVVAYLEIIAILLLALGLLALLSLITYTSL